MMMDKTARKENTKEVDEALENFLIRVQGSNNGAIIHNTTEHNTTQHTVLFCKLKITELITVK